MVGLNASNLGFAPDNVLTARASLQGPVYQARDAVSALYRRTLADLARVPGVEAAAVTNNLPVERGLNLVMRRVPENDIVPAAIDWRYVAGDYLRVLRIPLVAGRAFDATDHRAAAPPVQSVERVIRDADPLLSITAFRMMDEVVGEAVADTRSARYCSACSPSPF